MNRSEITKKVGQDIGDPALAKAAIDAFVHETSRALATGERVHISGLGSFTPRKVPRRRTRNPMTGEKVWAKTTGRVKFSPAASLVGGIIKGRLPKQPKTSAAAAPAKKTAPVKKAAATKKTTTAAKSPTKRTATAKKTAAKATAPAKKTATAKKTAAKATAPAKKTASTKKATTAKRPATKKQAATRKRS